MLSHLSDPVSYVDVQHMLYSVYVHGVLESGFLSTFDAQTCKLTQKEKAESAKQ